MSSFWVIIQSLELDVQLWISDVYLIHNKLKVSNCITVKSTSQDDPNKGNDPLIVSRCTNISVTNCGESLKCPIDSDYVFHAIRIILKPLPHHPVVLVGIGRVYRLEEFSEPVPQASNEMVQENNYKHHTDQLGNPLVNVQGFEKTFEWVTHFQETDQADQTD